MEAGWPLLSPVEMQRAARMRPGRGRDEFIAGRGALRRLLAREMSAEGREVDLDVNLIDLDVDPREISFRVGTYGKPSIEGDAGGLEFNLAHSQGLVLIALSRAGAVGIDVEDPTRPVEALEIARTNFHAEEIAWLESRPERERTTAFYWIWTRKEAVAKADGRGLMLLPSSYSVCGWADLCDVAEDQSIGITFEEWEEKSSSGMEKAGYYRRQYSLSSVDPGRGFLSALALEHHATYIHQFDLDCGDRHVVSFGSRRTDNQETYPERIYCLLRPSSRCLTG